MASGQNMALGHQRHAPMSLPPGVEKRPQPQRGARLPPLPAGHSARVFVEGPQTARAHQVAARQPRQRKLDLNQLSAQLQAYHEAKARAVKDEDYAEAGRLKQLIADLAGQIKVAMAAANEQAPPEPPPPPAVHLAGSIYDGALDGIVRKPMPPPSHTRAAPVRSQRHMRGSPELSEQPTQAAPSGRGTGGMHLRDASEAAQACVPPPRGGRKIKEGTPANVVPAAVVPQLPEPASGFPEFTEQEFEEALGFETADLLHNIVERNLLAPEEGESYLGDLPSSAETVQDADAEMALGNAMWAVPAPWHPAGNPMTGPAPTLDDLLSGNAGKRALRPVKEPARRHPRAKPQKHVMNHGPAPSPLSPRVPGGDQSQEEERIQKRLDAMDRRQPLTAR